MDNQTDDTRCGSRWHLSRDRSGWEVHCNEPVFRLGLCREHWGDAVRAKRAVLRRKLRDEKEHEK